MWLNFWLQNIFNLCGKLFNFSILTINLFMYPILRSLKVSRRLRPHPTLPSVQTSERAELFISLHSKSTTPTTDHRTQTPKVVVRSFLWSVDTANVLSMESFFENDFSDPQDSTLQLAALNCWLWIAATCLMCDVFRNVWSLLKTMSNILNMEDITGKHYQQ